MILDRYGDIFKSRKITFTSAYKYWKNELFKYLSKTFTVSGFTNDYLERHFKTILLIDGKLGATRDPESGAFVFGRANLYGITPYFDEYPSMNIILQGETIKCNDILTDNRDGVLVKNDSLMNGFRQKINLYATLLAHCDVTIKCGLVNRRDNNIFKSISQAQSQGIKNYRRSLEEGKADVIVDPGFSMTRIEDVAQTNMLSLAEVMDIRERLLTQYLEDIGLRKKDDKRERLVTAEVNADSELLDLNMLDVYNSWQSGIADLNAYIGTDLSVTANINLEKAEGGDADANNGRREESETE